MLVRGIGMRDVSVALKISAATVLQALDSGACRMQPKESHYDRLETDGFWTYVGKKKRKVWLTYAHHRGSGGIAAHAWGKRSLKTAKKLRKRLKRLGISRGLAVADAWGSFVSAFREGRREMGKAQAGGMEGNNCRLRRRARPAFRRACCFSMNLRNHWKAFAVTFFYINYGFV
jgi:IS1 family transposase